MERWRRVEWWDRYLGDSCIRIPGEQLMPWRVIRRIPGKRDDVVKALREAGYDVGASSSAFSSPIKSPIHVCAHMAMGKEAREDDAGNIE
jgi:hypothetical protein